MSKNHNNQVAKRFFRKVLSILNSTYSIIITIDKNPAYKLVVSDLKCEKKLKTELILREMFIKKKVYYLLGFKFFKTAKKALSGIEDMYMLKKGQIKNQVKSVLFEIQFINNILGITC